MGILVRQSKKKGQPGRPVLKIGIAITATAIMSAGAASLLMAGGSGPVVLPYATMAAINTSNTTVGFADSDIIGMSQADINRTLDEMQAMGVQNVRILIPWNNVERRTTTSTGTRSMHWSMPRIRATWAFSAC